MGYRNLRECVEDLAAHGDLVRVDREVDPCLEAGAIQRRVYQAGGPALLFTRVKGCDFPLLGNLFGTLERTRFLFRDTLDDIGRLVELKVNPAASVKKPFACWAPSRSALHLLPRMVYNGPILGRTTAIDRLPQLKSWPDDGGAFITLPQVYSESAEQPGWRHSNLGMYRVQLSGNNYRPNRGGRAALPDPPRHRRSPCGGARARGPLQGQHLRRRSAGPDRGRRHAAAGGDARAVLCRAPRRAADADGLPAGGAADAGRGRLLHHRHRRSRARPSRKGRSATTSATTAWPTISRCSGSSRSITATGPSGRLPRSAGRRRKTPRSAPSSTS